MKEEQIDKSIDNSHMNRFVLGKADSFTGESFDICAQGEMVPPNTLCIFLAGNKLMIGNFAAISEVIVRINRPNGKRLKQLQKFHQVLMFLRAKHRGKTRIRGMIHRPPQPYLAGLVVIKAPHFVHFRR